MVEELDDEIVNETYFDSKIQSLETAAPPAAKKDMFELPIMEKFISFGLSKNILT
jgi:hypothetical protein